MKLDLTQRGGGVVLKIQAFPGSRRNAVLGDRNGALRVAITQVAEKGKANKALLDVLAKQLGLRKSQCTIIAGVTSQQKQVFIDAITVDELVERIERTIE